MKKYVKPDLVFETYELSHSVANCGLALNHGEDTCQITKWEDTDFGYSVFTAGVNCTYDPDIWEDYCKFTGSGDHNVFSS